METNSNNSSSGAR